MKLKVLFTIPTMGEGGSERVLLNLLRQIDEQEFEIHLALLEGVHCYLNQIPPHVTVHHLGVRRARYAFFPLAWLCWKVQPAAILSFAAHLNSIVLASRPLLHKKVRILVREGTDINRMRQPQLSLYKFLYRHADAVICQSNYMRQQIIQELGVDPSRAKRIYNPVDVELVRKLADSAVNPFGNSGPNLVSVGRFAKVKGVDLLLEAMNIIRKVFPASKLTLVGDGPLRSSLEEQTNRLGLRECVRFTGSLQNPYPYIKNADALVLSSRYEGFPNVVLEAMVLGVTVVSTNCCGGLSEMAAGRDRMIVVPDHSAEAMGQAIIRTLKREGQCNRMLAPEFIKTFGIVPVTSQYQHLLRSTIEGTKAQVVCTQAQT